ncbi:DNA methyltransferase, partial [Micrococcus sp. F3Y]|uniref:DNA methyltransferase n=1 Tax=Micrococcus sp. F3Y TaxID=3402627 RepID=UPI003AF6D38D
HFLGQDELCHLGVPSFARSIIDFAVPERQYLEETGQVDDQGNATTSRIETGGRKHAPWLTMMFPRLALARHLLRRDGVILVSIDDNEVHHLRLLLDAVFGGENFVGNFIWNGGLGSERQKATWQGRLE